MCTRDNLRVCLLGLNTLIMVRDSRAKFVKSFVASLCAQVSAIALVMMAFVLWFNDSFNTAYGSVVAGWGTGLFLAALILAAVGCTSFYGAAKHNKCMLLTSSGLACLVILIQVVVAKHMEGFVQPAFPDALVDACVEVRRASATCG